MFKDKQLYERLCTQVSSVHSFMHPLTHSRSLPFCGYFPLGSALGLEGRRLIS